MIIIVHTSPGIRQIQKQWLSWPISGLSLRRLVPEWALAQISRGRERQTGLLLLQCWSDGSQFWPWTGSGRRGSRVTVVELLHRETWRQRTELCRPHHCRHFRPELHLSAIISHGIIPLGPPGQTLHLWRVVPLLENWGPRCLSSGKLVMLRREPGSSRHKS